MEDFNRLRSFWGTYEMTLVFFACYQQFCLRALDALKAAEHEILFEKYINMCLILSYVFLLTVKFKSGKDSQPLKHLLINSEASLWILQEYIWQYQSCCDFVIPCSFNLCNWLLHISIYLCNYLSIYTVYILYIYVWQSGCI